PLIFILCDFLYFVLLGCNMTYNFFSELSLFIVSFYSTTFFAAKLWTVIAPAVTSQPTGSFTCESRVRRKISLAKHLTAANPYFYANAAIRCVCLCYCIINVGTQGVQRCSAVFVSFCTGHFGSAQTTGNLNFNTLCSQSHR